MREIIMKWNQLGEMDCPVARSLSILGDRWTLLIIRNALLNTKRFDDFHEQLGMTRHLLAERLNRLIEHGIMVKVPYQTTPKRYEYTLTEQGKSLYPIILSLSEWGNQWLNPDQQYPQLHYLHKNCGQITRPSIRCSCCGEILQATTIKPILENTA